ncbi:MAG: glycerophosphodiester phosphodiesterase family protein [Bacteroides sp.]|jgi:glycerophosphoryl diester phosphodiesterase|nr:glycerophosphodiester phosphodiesterase family protein [Bacteroides sp.]MCI1683330.1 glycerophosphodiester phosphodiesterase family protein [Bacteroides sp.]
MKVKLFVLISFLSVFACSNDNKAEQSNEDTTEEGAEGSLRKAMSVMRKCADYHVMLCSHRGNTFDRIGAGIPENSLSAIENCIAKNIEMIEIDVRTTKDGVLVLMHDETINRTTTGKGYLRGITYKELQEYFLLKEDGTATKEKVPTLAEALNLGAGKIWFNLDLDDKKDDPENIVDAVKAAGMLDNVLFFLSTDVVSGRTYLRLNNRVMLHFSASKSSQIETYTTDKDLAPAVYLIQVSPNGDLPTRVHRTGRLAFANSIGDSDVQLRDYGNDEGLQNLRTKRIEIIQTDIGEIIAPYVNEQRYSVVQ